MHHRASHHVIGSLALGAVLAGLLLPAAMDQAAARSTAAMSPAIPRISVDSKTFAVSLPSRIPAGLLSVSMTGAGQPWTGVNLGRIKPGVSRASILAALKRADYQHAGSYVVAYGGVSHSGTMVANFTAGPYVIFDTEQDARGKPIYAYKFFTVGPASGPMISAPTAAATWVMDDMKFKIPASIPAGMDTIKITNPDQVEHMAITGKLLKGKTFQDLITFIKMGEKGAPPIDPSTFGGLNSLGAGMTAYLTQQFTPGEYAVICFAYDPKKHVTHEVEGMVNHFMVP